jgi:hypothetical protein
MQMAKDLLAGVERNFLARKKAMANGPQTSPRRSTTMQTEDRLKEKVRSVFWFDWLQESGRIAVQRVMLGQ